VIRDDEKTGRWTDRLCGMSEMLKALKVDLLLVISKPPWMTSADGDGPDRSISLVRSSKLPLALPTLLPASTVPSSSRVPDRFLSPQRKQSSMRAKHSNFGVVNI